MSGSDPTRRYVEAALAERVNPMLRAHGGAMRLVSIDDGDVRLRFEAACVGCALRAMTMATLVEPALADIPGVKQVDGGVPMSSPGIARLRAAVRGDDVESV